MRRGARNFRPNSAVNVTPLVDVMLVLLIIFMVTAPMMTTGVKVDLPASKASQTSEEKDPLVVSIDAKGEVFLQETKIPMGELVTRLKAILGTNPGACVYVRGDKTLRYSVIMDLMSFLVESGIEKVALVAEAVPSRSSK